jgi:hypothetical protein
LRRGLLHRAEDHVERHGAKGIVHGICFELWGWRLGLKYEALLLWKLVEHLHVDAQVPGQHSGVVVGKQVGDRKRAVLGELAVRKRQQEFAAVVRQALDRVRDA